MKRLMLLGTLGALLLAACGQSDSGGTASTATASAGASWQAPATPTASTANRFRRTLGPTYRIGAVLSLSGSNAEDAKAQQDTLMLMQDVVITGGGIDGPDGQKHLIEMLIIDDQSDEQRAAQVTQTLIDRGAIAIIGSSSVGPALKMIPVVTAAEVPMVALAPSDEVVEPASERGWIFNTAPNAASSVEALVSELVARRLNDVALISSDTPYGIAGRKAFTEAATARNINVLADERYDAQGSNAAAALEAVKTQPIEAVINWGSAEASAEVAKQMKAQNIALPIYHSNIIASQAFIAAAGDAANGSRFMGNKLLVADELPESDQQKTEMHSYINAYTGRFSRPVSVPGGQARDALMLILNALERSGDDRSLLRDELENTNEYVGVSGIYSMSPDDHIGLDERGLAAIEIRDGTWHIRLRGGARG